MTKRPARPRFLGEAARYSVQQNPNLISFPEKPVKDAEMEGFVRSLYRCDKRSMTIIKATVKAALESQSERL